MVHVGALRMPVVVVVIIMKVCMRPPLNVAVPAAALLSDAALAPLALSVAAPVAPLVLLFVADLDAPLALLFVVDPDDPLVLSAADPAAPPPPLFAALAAALAPSAADPAALCTLCNCVLCTYLNCGRSAVMHLSPVGTHFVL